MLMPGVNDAFYPGDTRRTMSAKETAGKIYRDLQMQKQDKITVYEMTEAITGDYMPKLVDLVEQSKPKSNDDFYIECCHKQNQIMLKTLETYMKARHTCPTPFWDRSVFRYNRKDDKIEYLWTLPDIDTAHWLIRNALHLGPEDKALLSHVLDYQEGKLLKLAMYLNKETNDYNLEFYRKDADGQRITPGIS